MTIGAFIPWIALLAAVGCALCAFKPALSKLAGWLCVGAVGLGFVITLVVAMGYESPAVVRASTWFSVGQVDVGFSYYFDTLTLVMLGVVTGIGSLIALYATGYMRGDKGYARFFFGVALFIFSMTTLVMADNLVLLFLGWEGVGLCSYLLIGYYYDKPFAVSAAKKAFIVNRIGDLGFLLGIFLCYQSYGTLSIPEIAQVARSKVELGVVPSAIDLWIPFLLMIGAFGKSAQIPLFVWLPDAMAGPTPVSALVHAATMVTSGVYLVARFIPVFELSPYALPTVAVVGAATALLGATIALCSNDLKGVFAYSTVSQLGYMFVGVGALSTFGGVFHLFTHAFFKALLFLTAGSVMHALAGQLDIRTMSGLRKKLPVTCWLMFAGCLALAGFPFTAGFYSKDTILADTMAMGINDHHGFGRWYTSAAWVGILTALLTAFYTFRLWFTVFMGEERFEMGDEHHHAAEHGHGDPDHAEAEHVQHAPQAHSGGPHEMPWFPMNLPLVVLAVGALLAGVIFYGSMKGWVAGSTANPVGAEIAVKHGAEAVAHADEVHHASGASGASGGGAHASGGHHAKWLGGDVHTMMALVSGTLAVVGIGLAAFFFWLRRDVAETVASMFGALRTAMRRKWWVDELYDAVLVRPLRFLSDVLRAIDELVVGGLLLLVGHLPGFVGLGVRPAQNGKLQTYGLAMVLGVGVLAVVVMVLAR